ncbi:MAG TPA: hypothetical protein VFZ93_04635 [Albitalea sp.]
MQTILFMAVLSLAVLAGAAATQTRKEQADRVVTQYDAPSAACALLSNAEVVKVTGRRSYGEPQGTQLTNGGSACDYDDVNLTLFSGPKSAEHYEALLKNFKKDKAARTPLSGVGDSAYLMVLTSGPTSEPNQHAVLVVRSGVHTMAVSMEAQKAQTPQSLQPVLTSMARTALGKLR